MTNAPKSISISYETVGSHGLLCAFSDDLQGLRVVGRSREEVDREVPALAAALVKNVFGVEYDYRWNAEHAALRARA
jgi:hypothetical protein